nr:MAG TPA: hypothetical protein [Caudoviricetes sp.]
MLKVCPFSTFLHVAFPLGPKTYFEFLTQPIWLN